jgi:hypothetical protein
MSHIPLAVVFHFLSSRKLVEDGDAFVIPPETKVMFIYAVGGNIVLPSAFLH